jgi:hypothetical protein
VLMDIQASCLLVSFSSLPDAPWARRAADRLARGAPAVRTDLGQRPLRLKDQLRRVGEIMEAHAARTAGHGAAEPAFNPAGAVPPGV